MAELTGNSTKTAKCKPRGKPFEKGVSGNPSGRKPIPQEFKELAESHSISALEQAIKIMKDVEAKYSDRLKAVEIVLDRGIGKPVQTLDVGNKDGEAFKTSKVDLSHLTVEQIKELLENEDKADS